LPRLNESSSSIGIPIAVEYRQFGARVQLIARVASPVPDGQVQLAVTIEIPGRNARPPSIPARESPFRGHVLEFSVIISKYTHRSPFECQRKVGPTVAVQVGKDRAADQANGFKRPARGRRCLQFAMVVEPQRRRDWLGISARAESSA